MINNYNQYYSHSIMIKLFWPKLILDIILKMYKIKYSRKNNFTNDLYNSTSTVELYERSKEIFIKYY